MRRIKKTTKTVQNSGGMSPETRNKVLIGAIAVFAFIVITVLILVEDSMSCTYTIENNTDMNIKNLEVVFEDYMGDTATSLYLGSLDAGKEVKGKYEAFDFSEMEDTGDMWVYVEFEGKEGINFIDGLLYNKFDGYVDIKFEKEDGEYRAYTDSGKGLFTGSGEAGIEATIQLEPDTGDWNYMIYSKEQKKWIVDESMKLEWDELSDEDFDDLELSDEDFAEPE